MIPVYSVASYLQCLYYDHAVYFQLTSDPYAAFALASFFNLLATYAAPHIDELTVYLRRATIKPWKNSIALPVGLLRKCFGGERGPFRTPRSGLTWYNVCISLSPTPYMDSLTFDVDCLARGLPILSGYCLHGHHRHHHASFRPILSGVSEPSIFPYLGKP
jgi:hypothetical protein